MKVLFELPLESSESRNSQFEWLSDPSNRLFLIEGGRRMRTISIGAEPGRVLESANLADGRVCTSFSWNKDGNLLAMIVDKSLIYFWDVRDNNLLHYVPMIKTSGNANLNNTRNRTKDVGPIVWSRVTNKVVVGYSSGQLLLCNHESRLSEIVIDNSSGVLREVSSIESSPHLDVFACITVIFELLVMTFGGEALFYSQGGDHVISCMKFSAPFIPRSTSTINHSASSNKPANQSFWLAHSSNQNAQIHFKMIELKGRPNPAEAYQSDNLVHQTGDHEERIDHYEWVDSSSLIVCSVSGIVSLVQIKTLPDKLNVFALSTMKMLEIHTKEVSIVNNVDGSIETQDHDKLFKSFKLICHSNKLSDLAEDNRSTQINYGKSFSFSAMTMYRMFYYELLEMDNDTTRYTFEKIDELDLTGSLKKINLGLERLQWSFDSSMLAVQLTNGHILIYQTRLKDHMVTSYGHKTAYLSEPDEVTILNYGLSGGGSTDEIESSNLSRSPVDSGKEAGISLELTSKASIIKVDLRPSVIAIGPKHLAVGLNNLVRFYSTHSGDFQFQEEYHSIVSSICLCLRFASVRFGDGRLKLHPLKGPETGVYESGATDDSFLNERYFPDPTSSECISAFTLTDDLFIYATRTFNLYVFCLKNWSQVQVCNYHGETGGRPIVKFVPDGRGNKYLCLIEISPQSLCRVYLYDGYRNEMTSFVKENKLYADIFRSQLDLVPTLRDLKVKSIALRPKRQVPDLSRISSVIWDTDGRSVLLMDRKRIHIFVILDHTLESEGPIIEWVTTIGKQSTYATLYASHGVISFQTSLGRVINSISESHDDEANLAKLGQQIQATISQKKTVNEDGQDAVGQAEIMRLKLEYFQIIVLIYPLSKCAEICEYIMSDSQFNVAEGLRLPEIDDVLWRQLAARAIFTSNLQFALLVYKGRRLQVLARALGEIVDDVSRFGFDSKASVSTRLLILLGCDSDDDD